VVAICAVICGVDSWEGIELFGKAKERNGTHRQNIGLHVLTEKLSRSVGFAEPNSEQVYSKVKKPRYNERLRRCRLQRVLGALPYCIVGT